MACKYGRAKLKDDDDRRLFSESAGTCLLCQQSLFPLSRGGRSIPIVERAHIVAHSPSGPRGTAPIKVDVDEPANLVLLCPTCHTKVDKAPADYPAESLHELKGRRAAAVARVGGLVIFTTRADARAAAELLLRRNRTTFERFGPDREDGSFSTLEGPDKWRELVLAEIVPNNEVLVAMVEVNAALTTDADHQAAELLRAHTRDLGAKHRGEPLLAPAPRFPPAAETIFARRATDD